MHEFQHNKKITFLIKKEKMKKMLARVTRILVCYCASIFNTLIFFLGLGEKLFNFQSKFTILIFTLYRIMTTLWLYLSCFS